MISSEPVNDCGGKRGRTCFAGHALRRTWLPSSTGNREQNAPKRGQFIYFRDNGWVLTPPCRGQAKEYLVVIEDRPASTAQPRLNIPSILCRAKNLAGPRVSCSDKRFPRLETTPLAPPLGFSLELHAVLSKYSAIIVPSRRRNSEGLR